MTIPVFSKQNKLFSDNSIFPMIPFGYSTLTSEKDYEDLISRIEWKVEKRRNLLFPKSNSLKSETGKPLVGKVDEKIVVTRVRPFYATLFPQIFAGISIDNTLTERRIIIKYQMGVWTSLFFIQIILTTILILYNLVFSTNDMNSILDSILYLLMYPGFATILAALEANKLKEKIIEVLEK